jgi:hypothetical protein
MRVLDDFDFSVREVEKTYELEVVAWAESNGWICRKIAYVGRRSCPDRLFAGYGQLHLIEMKKKRTKHSKAGRLSSGQDEEFKRLAGVGVEVKIFYDAETAIAFLKSCMPLV